MTATCKTCKQYALVCPKCGNDPVLPHPWDEQLYSCVQCGWSRRFKSPVPYGGWCGNHERNRGPKTKQEFIERSFWPHSWEDRSWYTYIRHDPAEPVEDIWVWLMDCQEAPIHHEPKETDGDCN